MQRFQAKKRRIRQALVSFAVLVALGALCPAPADAVEYYGSSRTIPYAFQSYYDGDGDRHIALYEFADIHAQSIGSTGLTMHFGGWARGDLAEPENPDQEGPGDADLTYFYVRWDAFEDLLTVYAGRHFVVAGVTAENIDGIDLVCRPFGGFALRAFGGIPVFSKIGLRDEDYGYGGRASYAWRNYLEIGASYHAFYEEGEADRDALGADLYIAPDPHVDLIGHASYDLIFEELYDATGNLNVYPLTDLRLSGFYRYIVPTAFLGRTSYFTVFSAETINEIDGELSYLLARRVRVIGSVGQYVYDEADDATRAGGGVEILWGETRDNVFGLRGARLDRDDNGYDEARAYVYQKFLTDWHVAANATAAFLDRSIYEVDTAFDGDLSLGWRFWSHWDVQATSIFRSGPYYDAEYQGLLRLGFNMERPI
ncbi:hypothetical protein K8I61_07565 [bacterium]|nr:hypothetical protein [bacterium]